MFDEVAFCGGGLVFIVVLWLVFACTKLWRTKRIHLDKMAHFAMFFGQFYLLGRVFVVNRQSQFFGLWLCFGRWSVNYARDFYCTHDGCLGRRGGHGKGDIGGALFVCAS